MKRIKLEVIHRLSDDLADSIDEPTRCLTTGAKPAVNRVHLDADQLLKVSCIP